MSLVLPMAPTDYGCDSDNNGVVDKHDGELNKFFAGGLFSYFFDANALLASDIYEGRKVLLADLVRDLADGPESGLTINMYPGVAIGPPRRSGAHPSPFPCFDVDATRTGPRGATATSWNDDRICEFTVDPASYDAGGCPITRISGVTVGSGRINAGPVNFRFPLPLGAITLDVPIEGGRFSGNLPDSFRITGGRLCGQVEFSEIERAFDQACTTTGAELCSFKLMALPVMEMLCKESCDTKCSVVIAFESAPAGKFAVEAPE